MKPFFLISNVNFLNEILPYIEKYGLPLLLAIILLIIGLRIIKVITKTVGKNLNKRNDDVTLNKFITSLVSWILKIILFISVAGIIGIPTTSFVAILGAAGLAIGLALQGTLANFAGGVLALIFKPYEIGDLIETQGEIGVVKEIQIFNTILTSPDNKKIILPNGAIMNGNIKNYTAEGKIRVDLTMGIAYDADIKKAKNVLLDVMRNHNKVLADPTPFVGVSELGDNSVNLAVRPFTKPEHYWDVYFDIYEASKIALDENNIGIPFPQVDVHMK